MYLGMCFVHDKAKFTVELSFTLRSSSVFEHSYDTAAFVISTSWLLLRRKIFYRSEKAENLSQSGRQHRKKDSMALAMAYIHMKKAVNVDQVLKRWDSSGHTKIRLVKL